MSDLLFKEKLGQEPLFSLAFHPSAPYYVKGGSRGRVTACKYSDEDGEVTQLWTTKRHAGSCRALAYDHEGENVYSVGADMVVKKAAAMTGLVSVKAKLGLPAKPNCVAVNESFLAVGDDAAGLSVFDLRDLKGVKTFEDVVPGGGYVSSITPLAHKNKYQFVVSGDSQVAVVDVRKGVLTTSEDQEDEILCGCMAGDKVGVFGMSEGVLTLWNEHFEDQQNRVRVSQDPVYAVVCGEDDDVVFAGCGDGIVREVNVRSSKVMKQYMHSKESVDMLEFDYKYRLVTADTDVIKVWKRPDELPSDQDEEEDESKSKKRKKRTKSKAKKLAKVQAAPIKGITAFDDL